MSTGPIVPVTAHNYKHREGGTRYYVQGKSLSRGVWVDIADADFDTIGEAEACLQRFSAHPGTSWRIVKVVTTEVGDSS